MEQPKTVNINGAEIPVLLNNRALVNYKRDVGRQTVVDLEDALRLAWHSVRAGAQSISVELKMTFEEWIDYTDAHPEIMEVSDNDSDTEREAVEGDKKKATT